MDASAVQGLDLLPPEILSQVFGFLHIEDRKKVRLVCKKWNALCSCSAITRNEKFLFRNGHQLENIDVFLQNCERVRPTIEFQGLSLTQLPSESTWRRIGDQIHSLSLVECVMSKKTTKNIFLYCPNMHTYTVLSQFHYSSADMDDLFCSPETLDELIQLNIVRLKMTSFQLFLCHSELSNNFLRKIFKIFPRIQAFGAGYPSYRCVTFGSVNIGPLRDTFDPVLIKELTINVPSSDTLLQELVNVSRMKLQKLETIIRFDSGDHSDKLIRFLRDQPELRTLKLSFMKTMPNDSCAKMILSESLSICPNLVNLRQFNTRNMSKYEFFKVLRMVSTSKLECFMLSEAPVCYADDAALDSGLTNFLTPLANKTLQTLYFGTVLYGSVPENYCSPILTHFCNLHHLELTVASDKVLQTIFQYHIHLYTLILHGIGKCTAFGFTGRKIGSSDPEEITYSISRLSELRHLELEGFLSDEWVGSTLREFNFPHLKYLRLSLWGLEEEISIDFLSAAVPFLEQLMLDEVPVSRDHLLKICKHLYRLKTLFYTWCGHSNFNDQLFTVQPSLTYIVDPYDNAYYYNRFTKETSLIDFRSLRFKDSVFRDFIRLPM